MVRAAEPRPATGPTSVSRILPWVLTLGGLIGLASSAILIIEKIRLLSRPGYVPTCSINPIMSCGSVMNSWQAEALGLPNPLLGVAGFAVVTTIGVAVLARAVLPRWFWLGLQTGAALGLILIHWLIFQSLYRINALCPYCMIVWAVTIPIFWYVTVHNLCGGMLSRAPGWRRIGHALARYHSVVPTVWLTLVVLAVAHRFWDYWSSLL
ncbi:vitamin K epoxide reductase family protein [Micromonospora sp. NPDC050397]|uniref:vitamin K epoxide reductase family protein n=1 Tax=Micromonospora sp. NPDC050397 TaxID=3364279 RepID=UPI00384F58CC